MVPSNGPLRPVKEKKGSLSDDPPTAEGLLVGVTEGTLLGLPLGGAEGQEVGIRDGIGVGSSDGMLVGLLLG